MQYLPFESKTFALTTFQRGDYPRLFLFHVFLWIDSPVDGEPALLRHDVEVCPPAAFSSQHQDGTPCLICPDVVSGGFLLHFSLQLLYPFNNLNHTLECILALMLQTNMRGLP